MAHPSGYLIPSMFQRRFALLTPPPSVWIASLVAMASLVLLFPSAHASTQLSQEQVYLSQIATTKWPQDLPRDQGGRTLAATLDWLSQASSCQGADWIAEARRVLGEPDATTLAAALRKPISVRVMKMEQAVQIRRCLNILLAASDLADDGSDRAQQQSLALRLYLSSAAPLNEARSQLIDDALVKLQTQVVLTEPMASAKTYVSVATQRFDDHLESLLNDVRLNEAGFDTNLALRRLAAERTLTKRWVVEILGKPAQEMNSSPEAIASLVERLESVLVSHGLAQQSNGVIRQIADEAKYIRDHLPAIRQQAQLRRDVTPIITAYVRAIALNDRNLLQATSLPLQVKAFGNTLSLLGTITNSDAATDIKLASIVEVQQIEPTRAQAVVHTIITEAGGRAYPSSLKLSLTLTEDGWRVGTPEIDASAP